MIDRDQVDDRPTVLACPSCESAEIVPLVHGYNAREDAPDEDWRCDDCQHRFDDPLERPSRSNADTRSGLAKKLLDVEDPDALIAAAKRRAAQ